MYNKFLWLEPKISVSIFASNRYATAEMLLPHVEPIWMIKYETKQHLMFIG